MVPKKSFLKHFFKKKNFFSKKKKGSRIIVLQKKGSKKLEKIQKNQKKLLLRGRVTAWDVFFLSRCGARVNSQNHSCSQVHSSFIQQDRNETTKLDVQLNSTRLTRATVFHNLCRDQHEISAPPLVCARSGYVQTICSDATQRRGFHHHISDWRLSILGRVFTQTG